MSKISEKTNTPVPVCDLSRRALLKATALGLPLTALVAQGATLPRLAPAFKAPRPGGQPPIEIAAYKGKVVALMFLLTTCPHCQAFSKTMEKLSKELGPQGFQPLGIAINDPTGRLVTAFARDTGATFPIGYIKQEAANEFLEFPSMKTMYMPQLAIIDRTGKVRYQHPGEDSFYNDQEGNLRKEVKLLLAEKAAAGAPAAAPKATKKKQS